MGLRVRNSEAVKSQQSTVRGGTSTMSAAPLVDAVRSQRQQGDAHRKGRTLSSAPRKQWRQAQAPAQKCGWCGRDSHRRKHCPARNAQCRKCSKTGHFEAVCRSAPSKGAVMSAISEDNVFLGTIGSKSAWTERVYLNDIPFTMKVDTGADKTALPESVYKEAFKSAPALSQPDRVLRGPDGKRLPTVGTFRSSVSSQPVANQAKQQTVYMVRGLQMPLLGRPAI